MQRLLKLWSAGFIAGAVLLSGAMAGVVLRPVPINEAGPLSDASITDGSTIARTLGNGNGGGSNGIEIGAAAVSLYPDPPEGREWKTQGCQVLTNPGGWDSIEVQDTTWPQDPDCIYMGGYNIGPVRPAARVSDLGLWAKAIAASDGENTAVFGRIDAVGYFYHYDERCPTCGIANVQQALADEFDIPPGNVMFAASHAHTGPDFLGGWGGVPDWYLEQARDAMIEAGRQAILNMVPATVETGHVVVRHHNQERRNHYRSPVDNQLVWMRATDADENTIVTALNYPGHPVSRSSPDDELHPDWPVIAEETLENEFGGVGVFMPGTMGNISFRGGRAGGASLAQIAIGSMSSGTVVSGSVDAHTDVYQHPVTNGPLGSLALANLFDRRRDAVPASGSWGKNANSACRSASPVSVEATMGGIKIGDLAIMHGPGELFSSIGITLKSQLRDAAEVMVVGLANDELGYIIPSFESDPIGNQGVGFTPATAVFAEYEDAFAIDRCFGDRVTEGLLLIGRNLGF